jgi:hypothetical protein
LAIARGAALAALTCATSCGGKSERVTGGGTGGSSTVVGGLSPYPLEEIGCFGQDYGGGYVGQCCIAAQCYTPEVGGCLPADAPPPIWLPPGTGECGCTHERVEDYGIAGPYAPNPNDTPASEGTCCYLVGSIGCEGRPFVVAGAAMVAPLVFRDDWRVAFA